MNKSIVITVRFDTGSFAANAILDVAHSTPCVKLGDYDYDVRTVLDAASKGETLRFAKYSWVESDDLRRIVAEFDLNSVPDAVIQ